jgi:nitroreductase
MVMKEINERYSTRNFTEQMPSNEQILNILEAGRLAPSWMNVQPWQFIVIKNPETKNLLSQLSHGQPHVANAPVVIACCGDKSAWDRENFKKTLQSRQGITEEKIDFLLGNPIYNTKLKGQDAVIYRTIEELTYAIAYMTLEIHELGLATCVVGAIGNDLTESIPDIYKQVKDELNLPDDLMIVALLPVGYASPDIQKPVKSRKSPEQIFSFEKYGIRNA